MPKETPEQQKFYWLQQQLNCASAFAALAVLFVSLKLYAIALRSRGKRTVFGWSDGLVVASMIVFLGLCAFSIGKSDGEENFWRTSLILDRKLTSLHGIL